VTIIFFSRGVASSAVFKSVLFPATWFGYKIFKLDIGLNV